MIESRYLPSNKSDNMPDDIWETYAILTWGCNSMNAESGLWKRIASHPDPSKYVTKRDAEHVYILLDRAHYIITALLEESGRLEKYKKWEEEHKGE